MCGKIGRNSREAIFYIRQKRTMANFSGSGILHLGKITVGITHHSPTFAGNTASESLGTWQKE